MPGGRRGKVRQLKRDLAERNCPEAITALLAHSVRLGHKKLALLRCLQAEQMGVELPASLEQYCVQVAAAMPMELLVALSLRATQGRQVFRKKEDSGGQNSTR